MNNILGFGIYIVAQQIVLMPIISRILPEIEFSRVSIYISIFAILTNVFGSELGIVRQVLSEKCKSCSDYNLILLQLIPIVGLLSYLLLNFFGFKSIDIVALTLCIYLGNLRLYTASLFRLNHDFKKIVYQNLLYLIGVVLGLIFMTYWRFVFLPFLFAELFCFFYGFFYCDFSFKKIEKTNQHSLIVNKFLDFGSISLLVNLASYFDRLIIYPILGANAVAIYFATSSMSKVISLITNPLHGVILSWLKGDDLEFRDRVIQNLIKISVPLVLFVFIISLPITYISVRIFYPIYLNDALYIMMPICVGVAFSSMSSIVKGVLLKYVDSKKLIHSYLIYIFILVIFGGFFSFYYGLVGFSISTALANIALSFSFYFLLNRTVRHSI